MADKVSKEVRRKTMQSIRSSHTKLEDCVIKELWKKGLRFRRNVKSLLGNPDVAIKKYKVVIFIDSCFWHGCEAHCRMPSTRRDYWVKKIEKNKRRDQEINEYYKKSGWRVFRVWEHRIKEDLNESLSKVVEFVTSEREKCVK